MHQNVNKKMHITLQLMIHLTVQLRGAPEGTFDGTPKVALTNLYKDTQKGACDDPLKNELEVALELHQGLHLLMQWLMHKWNVHKMFHLMDLMLH